VVFLRGNRPLLKQTFEKALFPDRLYDSSIPTMSTLTIQIEDEAKAVVERVASEHNLSPVDFISVAIAQSLARSLKDPYL
jgi:predicted nucleic acid-binding protein